MLNETKENVERFFILYPGINAGWELDDPKKVKEFHWFLSSFLGWNAGPNLFEEINLRRQQDGATYTKAGTAFRADSSNLFLVPGNFKTTHYKIDNAQPVVDGVVFITKIEWSKKK
jgi:hypothetical protein